MHSIKNIFVNMPVRLKLLLGFGTVLLLLLAISLITYKGFDALEESNSDLRQVSSINSLVRDARAYEKNFFLKGREADAEATETAIKNARDIADTAGGSQADAAQQQAMAAIRTNLEEYQSAFGRMEAQYTESALAQGIMEDAAQESVSLFVEFEQRQQTRAREQLLEGDLAGAEAAFRRARRASELTRLLLDTRRLEKNYVISESAGDQARVREQIDGIRQGISELSDAGVDRTAIDRLETSFGRYAASFEDLTRNIDAMVADEALVTQEASSATERAAAAYEQEQSLMADVRRSTSSMLLAIVLSALGIGIVSAWLITRAIVGPLDQLVGHASSIADGDLTRNINTDRRDELGRLMMAMQVMTENLRRMVKEVADGISQIASAAEELSAVTEQTSTGASQQRDETDQVATAMNEMTATVQEVAKNAESAATSASESDQQAREGHRIVATAVTQIESLSDEVGQSAGLITRLRDDSTNIGTILDVIRGIAEQTNLLALNAAIEAARAGEQGRGFAVVADEVRALALRTHESTGEIETLVNTLQQGANEAAESMRSNKEKAEATVDVAREAGAALSTIAEAVAAIQAMNLQIATAVEEQTSVAEDISESVVNIREVTDQSATANNQIAVASNDLARLGGDLQRAAERFRF